MLGEQADDGIFAKAFEELGVEDIKDFMFIEPSQFKATETEAQNPPSSKIGRRSSLVQESARIQDHFYLV